MGDAKSLSRAHHSSDRRDNDSMDQDRDRLLAFGADPASTTSSVLSASTRTFDAPGGDGGLVGRERELRTLAGVFGSVRERGAALLLRGAVGVGKSALMAAAGDH